MAKQKRAGLVSVGRRSLGILLSSVFSVALSATPALTTTDDPTTPCDDLVVEGTYGANQFKTVVQVNPTGAICELEQLAIDDTIAGRGVSKSAAERNEVLAFGRDEVSARMYMRLADLIKRQVAGQPLSPTELDSLAWLRARVAKLKLDLANISYDEYLEWGNDPCGYTPPAPFEYVVAETECASLPTNLGGLFTGGPQPPRYKDFVSYATARYNEQRGNMLTNAVGGMSRDLIALAYGAAVTVAIAAIGATVIVLIANGALIGLVFLAKSVAATGPLGIGAVIVVLLVVSAFTRTVQIFEAESIGRKLLGDIALAQNEVDHPELVNLNAILEDSVEAPLLVTAFAAATVPHPGPSSALVTSSTPDPIEPFMLSTQEDGDSSETANSIVYSDVAADGATVNDTYRAWLSDRWWVVECLTTPGPRRLVPTLTVFSGIADVKRMYRYDGTHFIEINILELPDGSNQTTSRAVPEMVYLGPPVDDPTNLAGFKETRARLVKQPSLYVNPSSFTANEGTTVMVSGTYSHPDGVAGTVRLESPSQAPREVHVNSGSPFTLSWLLDNNPSRTGTVSAVSDEGVPSEPVSLSATISNVAPKNGTISFTGSDGSHGNFEEGELLTATVSFTDPGPDSHLIYIEWGDGETYVGSNRSATHTYASGRRYTVSFRIDDQDGGVFEGSTTVDINGAPKLSGFPSALGAKEGESVQLIGHVDDLADSPTVSVNWGDGHSSSATIDPTLGRVQATHTYVDEGSYVVTITATDNTGFEGAQVVIAANILNADPTFTTAKLLRADDSTEIPANGIPPGIGVKPSVQATDAGTLDTLTYTVNWGDGSPTQGFARTSPPVHNYAAEGHYTVTLAVLDNDNGRTEAPISLWINTLPTLTGLPTGATVDEGTAVSINGTLVDPTAGATRVEVDWGDGTTSQINLPPSNRSMHATHTYPADDGTWTAHFTPVDVSGFSGTTVNVNVTVRNVAPTLSGADLQLADGSRANRVRPGQAVTAIALFSDPGILDTHTVTVSWGDGTVTTTPNLTHSYAAEGGYAVRVAVTDDDGADSSTKLLSLLVNTPPEITGLPSTIDVDEGSVVTIAGTLVDVSPGAAFVDVTWSDGVTDLLEFTIPGDGPFSIQRDGSDDSTWTATLTPIDAFGTSNSAQSVTVVVNNVPPTLDPVTLRSADGSPLAEAGVLVARPITLPISFTDPGTLDEFEVVVDWGDGTSDVASGPEVFAHAWAVAADVTVTVTVRDDDGGQDVMEIPVRVRSVAGVAGDIGDYLAALSGEVADPGLADAIGYATRLLKSAKRIRDAVDLLGVGRPGAAALKLQRAAALLNRLAARGLPVDDFVTALVDALGNLAGTTLAEARASSSVSERRLRDAQRFFDQGAAAAAAGDWMKAARTYRDVVNRLSR